MIHILDPIETLKELVAIPSVNPMGRAVSGPEYFEHAVTDYLSRTFAALGIPSRRQPVAPLRENIAALLEADAGSSKADQLIVIEAHQDTVPTDGMTIEPWSPIVRDGRLYGRGSCDVKGGLAAMLAAFSRLAAERPKNRPHVVLASTVNEEHGFSGVKALCKDWGQGGSIVPCQPDAVIVAEPTCLAVVVAHKGAVRWQCRTHGRATHSSQPQLGENAIYRMAPVLKALEQYQQDVAPRLGEHALCGRPSLSVGTISGGLSVNTVPDLCSIEIDRRLLPGEDPRRAKQQVVEFLTQQRFGYELEHLPSLMESEGLSDDQNGALASRLSESIAAVTGDARIIGVPFGTNASTFASAGAPTVVFGPGDIQQAHTADEWISLDQLHLASEILYRFISRGL